jgi:hypothetical protein
VDARPRSISFRLYKTSDGGTGGVDFATFGTLQAARQQIEEWIKLATLIKSREPYDDESSHGFKDRILAEWKLSSDQKTAFVTIIKRYKSRCYHIQGSSIQVANQIEELTN